MDTERFWSKVSKTAGCWLWTASKTEGYGRFRVGSQRGLAHRVSWEIHNGLIPEGMLVLHKCDTPACVNPAHLFLGTNADNMADKVAKGRHTYVTHRGEEHGQAKLTASQAIDIYSRRGQLLRELATEFGVTPTLISRIRSGKCWTHIHKEKDFHNGQRIELYPRSQ